MPLEMGKGIRDLRNIFAWQHLARKKLSVLLVCKHRRWKNISNLLAINYEIFIVKSPCITLGSIQITDNKKPARIVPGGFV